MDKLNIVLIVLIFTSLVVIIGIFGKNLKNFKQAEKSSRLRDEFGKRNKKEGKFSFSFILSKFSDFFVWIAETFVSSAGKALKAAHSGLLEMKAKKGSINSLQKSATKFEENKSDSKTTKVVDKLTKVRQSAFRGRFSKNDTKTSIKEAPTNKKKNAMETIDYKEENDKNTKLEDFFQDNNIKEQEVQKNLKNDYFEESQKKSAKNKENEEDAIPKKSFFGRLNPFKKEKSVRERKILTEETFNEFSDGITVVSKDFPMKEEDVFMKDVIRAKHVPRKNMNDDDELGVDRQILEKRILQKIAANPKGIEGYRQLGELYIKMENFEDAYSAYKFILKVSARDVDASRKLEKIKLLKRLK